MISENQELISGIDKSSHYAPDLLVRCRRIVMRPTRTKSWVGLAAHRFAHSPRKKSARMSAVAHCYHAGAMHERPFIYLIGIRSAHVSLPLRL
jgi:hypothetical protein